jgi:hypothetical protein
MHSKPLVLTMMSLASLTPALAQAAGSETAAVDPALLLAKANGGAGADGRQ